MTLMSEQVLTSRYHGKKSRGSQYPYTNTAKPAFIVSMYDLVLYSEERKAYI